MESGESDGIGGIYEESYFYKDWIHFFLQGAKAKAPYITGGKVLLTLKFIKSHFYS